MALPARPQTTAPAVKPQQTLALEIAMRDSLEGLYELVSHVAYQRSHPHAMEILSIDPPGIDPHASSATHTTTPACPLRTARSHDVVTFLIERERLMA